MIAGIAGPIHRIGTEAHPAAKRGKWPVPHADCMAVPDRIEVDVIEVPRKIVLVAQRMLPISPLPNPALGFGGNPFASGQSMRKAAFDQAPAGGEIRIAMGQGPNRVEVFRHDHGSFDREGMSCPHLAKHRPQQVNMVRQQRVPAVGQIDRKEVAAAS